MSVAPARVAIVGGGILGLATAYRLASAGHRVDVYERSEDLGGLVGTFDFDGHQVDRFYHVVLPTDSRVRDLSAELGIGDDGFRFRHTRVGFFSGAGTCSMSSALELARFPVLRPADRVRLALMVARARRAGDQELLDRTELRGWLRELGGEGVYGSLWQPLLDSKFAGRYDDLPATYIHSRMRRMSGTRDRRGREVMGWMIGGYPRLIEALRRRVVALSGAVHPGTQVDRIAVEDGAVTGVVVGGELRPADVVISTLLPPAADRLLPDEVVAHTGPDRNRYLGVVCLVVRTDAPVSPYHTLSILDRSVPLTTVVETTHVVDPEAVGGSILYVARYVDPSDADLSRPAEDLERDYLAAATRVLPELGRRRVLGTSVQRSRVVEAVRTLDAIARPRRAPGVDGLILTSSADVYPAVVNSEAMLGLSDEVTARALAAAASGRARAAA